jgi:hypothetical protein
MHPTDKYMEAPTERSAKQEAEDSLRDAQKQKAPEIAERREKKVAQKPDYKSLDMKYEYEKPAEPVHEEGPARGAASAPAPASKMPEQQPAPAPEPAKKKAYIAKDEADLGKVAAAPKAAAPSVMMEQAAPAPGAASKHAEKPMLNFQSKKEEAPFDSCLAYEPTVSTLAGVITKVDFPGTPEYQDFSKGGKKETYWILKLNKPFCVRGKESDTLNVTEANVTEVQLVLGSMLYDKYRSLMEKPVTAKGTLFHAVTVHHHTQVLLQVQSIELLVK